MKYIDLNILESIIFVIPKIKKTIKQKDNDRLIILLDELLDVIINMHIVEHKQYSDYYGYSYMRHYPMFFNILAYYTSYKKNIAIDFKKKIFSNWHRFPLMLEEFLKQFILVNLDNSDTTSSYNMWKLYCVEIIKDADVYDDNDEYIIKLLIFDDLTIQNKWNSNLDIWLINHIPIIENWCVKFGNREKYFPSIVKMLKTIGFKLTLDHGIGWLYNILIHINNPDLFFKHSNTIRDLDLLLSSIWNKFNMDIKQNDSKLNQFIYLVDVIANQGAPHSIKLQRILEDDS